MRSLRTRSLRARIAATVVAAAIVLLSLAGLFVVRVVDTRMHDNVRAEALRALDDAIAQIRNAGSVSVVLTTRVGQPSVTVSVKPRPATDGPNQSTEAVGQTRADRSSWEVVGETTVERRMVDETSVYEASNRVRGAAGDITLVATAPLAETEQTIHALRWGLAITVPALALLLGAISALVTTRALRPVAKMRAEADTIADGSFHRRLTPTDRSPELAKLAGTMNEMIERLERSATRQRQFASDVSHEFRSPLATIRGTLELTARHPRAHSPAPRIRRRRCPGRTRRDRSTGLARRRPAHPCPTRRACCRARRDRSRRHHHRAGTRLGRQPDRDRRCDRGRARHR